MRMHTLLTISVCALLPAHLLLAQPGGSLTPPGAPAPTMKSLDEMEPRTPLVAGAPGVSVGASGTITISQPGSYYLTKNLTVSSLDGIVIGANGVTLDLRGFTISSTAAPAGSGAINVTGNNVAISNGHIVSGTTWNGTSFSDGPGFQFGILTSSSSQQNVRVRDVTVQGVKFLGISLDGNDTSVVESSVVDVCGISGITAGHIANSVARTCGSTAISGQTVSNCRGESIGSDGISALSVSHSHGISTGIGGSGNGINASQAVDNSVGVSAGGHGINCNGNVSNSYGETTGTSATSDGIFGFRNVTNSYGVSTGDDGIDAGANISNSYGVTTGIGDGIEAVNVMNSYGIAGANADDGIQALNVSNSRGDTSGGGDGIEAASNVMNSYGVAGVNADDGIDADYTVSFSRGIALGSDPADFGIQCSLAIGCTSDGGENIDNKYLMP